MSESTRMLLGLALGIIVMILLVMKTKVHSFMALLIAAMITGMVWKHSEKYGNYYRPWSYDGRYSGEIRSG